MKKFFGKIKTWFKNHMPTKRRIIQLYSALLFNANIKGFINGEIYKGGTKNLCVPGLNCYSCPGAVGSCPMGALQNALIDSKTRMPTYIFGIIILFGLLLGRTICGFLCPLGLGQELLYKIKTPKVKKSKVTRILSYLKYVVLILLVVVLPLMFAVPGFCEYICPAGTFEGGVGLLSNENHYGDYGMLGPLFTWKFIVLVAIIVLSVFIFRVFCRFLCPLGALYGFFCRIAMLGIKLDKTKCTDCGLCVSVCKMDIKRVGDHECISCGACISVCPSKAISWKGQKLFVRENETETPDVSEIKPLYSMLKPANTTENVEAVGTETVKTEAVETESVISVEGIADEQATKLYYKFQDCEDEEKKAKLQTEFLLGSMQTASVGDSRIGKPKKKWTLQRFLRVIAVALASVVLVGALVYYNFIDKAPETNVEVGGKLPDFTSAQTFTEKDGTFTYDGENCIFSNQRGKVFIINFWETWCTACIEELPEFDEIQVEYGDKVKVLALAGTTSTPEALEKWMTNKGWEAVSKEKDWSEFSLTIGYMPAEQATELGVTSMLPRTIILDQEGNIVHMQNGAMSKAELQAIIDPLLK